MRVHPELAVLTLDLPDSDGEPMENERERFQILLLLDALNQHWKDRQDFYTGGNMFLYYSAEQAHQIIDEIAEPARPRRAFRGPDAFIVLHVDGSFRRQKWVVWKRVDDTRTSFSSFSRRRRPTRIRPRKRRCTSGCSGRRSITGTILSSPVYSRAGG